ncbi:TIR-like protein FxsC [Pseudosporangium ferrugineum]|uniref:TIR domain-containing protein n=1 Tax=Pseudosporangium ferrugineum TaxID=439699 RepID=A0A2T0RCH1_9ACTN|nr:TIR-like protein FxsC [Pseudosporangium ferrugineum]PRY18876.1 TIR domain-containing protein [Pseudosporangium ferrugineum]
MLYFFLSYARGDDDVYAMQFFRDLSTEVRVYAGLRADDEVGFVDQVSLRLGEAWSDQLGQALSSAQTFVALCSPRYFLSEPCGREWAVFRSRLRADATEALIPIQWVPMRDQPSVVRRFQTRQQGPETGIGLRQLLRLSRHRDDYLTFLSDLAGHIVHAAERFPVPAARPTAFDEVVSAFHERPVIAAPVGEHDPRSVVRAAFAAAGRPLEEGRLPNLLVPGPVWVSTTPTPVPDEVRQFADHLTRDRVAYFVHTGDLSLVEGALDRVRLDGRSVVTVPLRALRASLADRNGGSYLRDLERRYGNRDNLFDTKNALTDHRFLFGRDAMLNTVGSALRRDEHVLITGLRKVGKTSLLNVLRQYLVDQPVCTVDLQRFDRHHEDWPPVLFQLMLQAYDSWGQAEACAWSSRSRSAARCGPVRSQA